MSRNRSHIYGLSLHTGYPLLVTLSINLTLFVLVLIFYLIPSITAVLSLIFVILYTIHALLIWGDLIYELFFKDDILAAPTIWRILALYFITVTQYAFLYAIVLLFDDDSFTGIPASSSRIRKLLTSYFVSIGVLGSGIASITPVSDASRWIFAFSNIQSTLFFVLAVPVILSLIVKRREKTLKSNRKEI